MSIHWCIRRRSGTPDGSRHRALSRRGWSAATAALASFGLLTMRGVPSMLEVLVISGSLRRPHCFFSLPHWPVRDAPLSSLAPFSSSWSPRDRWHGLVRRDLAVVVPLEAPVGLRRVLRSLRLALGAAGLLLLTAWICCLRGCRPSMNRQLAALRHLGALYATGLALGGIARANEFLAALRGGGSLPPARPQYDRRHHAAQAQRAVQFICRRPSSCQPSARSSRARPVRPGSCRRRPTSRARHWRA